VRHAVTDLICAGGADASRRHRLICAAVTCDSVYSGLLGRVGSG
jgi:hypothetical protein